MKKIISLGIASAVLAMTALSASAAILVEPSADFTPGATVKVVFRTDAAGSGIQFDIVKSDNLEYVSAEVDGTVVVADDGHRVVFGKAAAAGDVLATLTYTVKADAKVGDAVKIDITNAKNVTGENVVVNTTVAEVTSSVPDSSSSTPESSTPESSTPDSGSKPGDNDNVETGIALAVFPAIIAGAAVVVAKKRK